MPRPALLRQSVDSSLPGFIMPNNWHGRRVHASNASGTIYDVRLIGWDETDTSGNPYCTQVIYLGSESWTFQAQHIRFINQD